MSEPKQDGEGVHTGSGVAAMRRTGYADKEVDLIHKVVKIVGIRFLSIRARSYNY